MKAGNWWQAAFVRPFPSGKVYAFKRFKSLLLYAFGTIFVIAPFSELINASLGPPVALGLMSVDDGQVVGIFVDRRQGVGNFSIQLLGTGEKKFFVHHLVLVKLRKGMNVRVWSQQGFRLFNGVIHEAREISIIGQAAYMLDHTKNLAWLEDRYTQFVRWNLVFLFLGVFLFTRPWWTHRKPI